MTAERVAGQRRGRLLAVSVAIGAGLLLSACSSVPNWAKPTTWYDDVVGGESKPPTATVVPPAAEATPQPTYPNVGPVPPRPTPPSAAAQAQIEKGLVAERKQAQYTAATLTGTPPNPPSGPAASPVAPEPVPPGSLVKPPPVPPPAATTVATAAPPPTTASTASPAPSPAPTASAAPTPPATQPREPVPPAPQIPAQAPVIRPAPVPATAGPAGIQPPANAYAGGPSAALVSTYLTALSASGESRTAGPTVTGQAGSAQPPGGPAAPRSAAPAPFAEAGIRHAATVYFASGSAQIPAEDQAVLRDIAAKSKSLGAMIRVVGYASPGANAPSAAARKLVNFNISFRRAQAVGNALIRAGAPPDNVLIVAASDHPGDSGLTTADQSDRPRVEIFLEN